MMKSEEREAFWPWQDEIEKKYPPPERVKRYEKNRPWLGWYHDGFFYSGNDLEGNGVSIELVGGVLEFQIDMEDFETPGYLTVAAKPVVDWMFKIMEEHSKAFPKKEGE